MTEKKLKVGVLFGGRSAEHEISLISARNVIAGLDRAKYAVVPIGIDRAGRGLSAAEAAELLGAPAAGGALPELQTAAAQTLHLAPGESDGALQTSPVGTKAALPVPVDEVIPILHGTYGEDGYTAHGGALSAEFEF